jgi:hypothetical protein
LKGSFTVVIDLIVLATRSIIFSGFRIEIAEGVIGASKDFQFIACAIPVDVAEAISIAVVVLLSIVTIACIVRVNGVEVASDGIRAPREFQTIANTIHVVVGKTIALTVNTKEFRINAAAIVHSGLVFEVASLKIDATQARLKFTRAILVVRLFIEVACGRIHAPAHNVT